MSLAQRRLNLNLAGFYYDYKDKQLAVYFADPIYTTLLRLDNIPKSRAYGVDGDLAWRATDELTIALAGTWLKTKIVGYQGINAAGLPADYDGLAFPYSPKFSGAATITYDTPITDGLGVRAILNGRYQSSTSSTIEDFAPLAIKDFGILNGSLAIYDLGGRWEASGLGPEHYRCLLLGFGGDQRQHCSPLPRTQFKFRCDPTFQLLTGPARSGGGNEAPPPGKMAIVSGCGMFRAGAFFETAWS